MSIQTSNILQPAYLHPRYWGTWFLIGLMRLSVYLPFRIQLLLGQGIGYLFFILIPKRKRITIYNIKLCFPKLSDKEAKDLAKETFQNAGIAIFETAMAWWASDRRIKKLYTFEGQEHLETAEQNGQPILLLSGHFCCTEISGRFLRQHYSGYQAMYKSAKNKLYNAFMYRGRSKYYDVVERKNSKHFLRNLRKGKMSWYAPDQNLSREEHVFAPFFDVPTLTITATSRITQIAKATVIPMQPIRYGSRYKLILKTPLENFPSGNLETDARKINESIEQGVLLDPAQYLWPHKRFHTLPDGSKRQYK